MPEQWNVVRLRHVVNSVKNGTTADQENSTGKEFCTSCSRGSFLFSQLGRCLELLCDRDRANESKSINASAMFSPCECIGYSIQSKEAITLYERKYGCARMHQNLGLTEIVLMVIE